MKLNDLNDLDLSNVGNWPLIAKIAVISLVCGLFSGGVFYFHTLNQMETRKNLAIEEQKQIAEVSRLAKKAALLDEYRKQLEEMQELYHKMRLRLPTKTQVAVLLEDISQKGRAAGLEFRSFDPQKEQRKDDFVELPIRIQVAGTYHELGAFVSDIAELPRIVTLHDISIVKDKDTTGNLFMTVLAKTYKYERDLKRSPR